LSQKSQTPLRLKDPDKKKEVKVPTILNFERSSLNIVLFSKHLKLFINVLHFSDFLVIWGIMLVFTSKNNRFNLLK
jgi:hypothetical protein